MILHHNDSCRMLLQRPMILDLSFWLNGNDSCIYGFVMRFILGYVCQERLIGLDRFRKVEGMNSRNKDDYHCSCLVNKEEKG
jgi:hypothetical protein